MYACMYVCMYASCRGIRSRSCPRCHVNLEPNGYGAYSFICLSVCVSVCMSVGQEQSQARQRASPKVEPLNRSELNRSGETELVLNQCRRRRLLAATVVAAHAMKVWFTCFGFSFQQCQPVKAVKVHVTSWLRQLDSLDNNSIQIVYPLRLIPS